MPFSADSLDMSAAPLRPLATRQPSQRHPLAMVFAVVAIAAATAALLSPSRASLALPGVDNAGLFHGAVSGKGPRLATEAEIACRGQAWGSESEACLEVIARESGRGESVKVRLIALGAAEVTAPNVF